LATLQKTGIKLRKKWSFRQLCRNFPNPIFELATL